MRERISSKPKFSELDLQGKVDYIMAERTPSPEEVIYEPVVEFLDQEGDLTREERGKVIGKQGRIIRAIRDLIKLMAAKQGIYADIVLEEQEQVSVV